MDRIRSNEESLESTIRCLELELADRDTSAINDQQAASSQVRSLRVQIDSMREGQNNSLEELELLRSTAQTVEKVYRIVYTVYRIVYSVYRVVF